MGRVRRGTASDSGLDWPMKHRLASSKPTCSLPFFVKIRVIFGKVLVLLRTASHTQSFDPW